MQPNIVAENYPVMEEKPNQQQQYPQQYQQQQPQQYQQQQVPQGYPLNGMNYPSQQMGQPYQPTQGQQQPYMNGPPVYVQPVVIVQQVRRVNADGCDFPADVVCPYCQKAVLTHIHYHSGCHTWLACWLLFLFFFPLFFLPFCFEECKDKYHMCPNCGKTIGKKKYKMCC